MAVFDTVIVGRIILGAIYIKEVADGMRGKVRIVVCLAVAHKIWPAIITGLLALVKFIIPSRVYFGIFACIPDQPLPSIMLMLPG